MPLISFDTPENIKKRGYVDFIQNPQLCFPVKLHYSLKFVQLNKGSTPDPEFALSVPRKEWATFSIYSQISLQCATEDRF